MDQICDQNAITITQVSRGHLNVCKALQYQPSDLEELEDRIFTDELEDEEEAEEELNANVNGQKGLVFVITILLLR